MKRSGLSISLSIVMGAMPWSHPHLASGMILLSSSTQFSPRSVSEIFDARDGKGPPLHSPGTLPQTQQDRDLTKWFEQEGILLGPEGGRRVQISTTGKSVGGRGLFWAPSITSYPGSSLVAQKGDILAHIPGHLVLLPSNMQTSYPCMFHDNNTNRSKTASSEDEASFSWQSVLTTYVWKALQESPNKHDKRLTPQWCEWIATWNTDSSVTGDDATLSGPQPPKPVQAYSSNALQEMARLTQSNVAVVKDLIHNKYATFQHDWETVKDLIVTADTDRDMDKVQREFAELYSLVLSRTANLGPEWGNQMGIIPLHDMINHPPYGTEANVELFCLGDIRSMIGNDGLKMLLRPLLTKDQLQGNTKPPTFMDHDFVIAARKRIDYQEELLLSYKSNEGEMTAKEQLLLLLQYGFPFRPASM